jgi:hypothetical protein
VLAADASTALAVNDRLVATTSKLAVGEALPRLRFLDCLATERAAPSPSNLGNASKPASRLALKWRHPKALQDIMPFGVHLNRKGFERYTACIADAVSSIHIDTVRRA